MTPNSNGRSFKVWEDSGQVHGPLDAATLVQWIQDKRLFPETFVQPQSDLRWRPAAEVETLRGKFSVAAGGGMMEFANGTASLVGALRQFPPFDALTNEGLEQMAALGKSCDVAQGDLIVQQGDPGDAVYFILSGELRVRLIVGVVDRMDKTLCKLGPGELFGELGMFLQSRRTADVVAEKPSQVFRISTNAVQLLIKQVPELASPLLFNLCATMARRIAEDNQRLSREVSSQFIWS